MAEDVKADELIDELRTAFAANIRAALRELPPHHALQLADSLCTVWLEQLAGLRVTHPAKPSVDGAAIAEDWRRGRSLREILRDHRCSKATAYRYHPRMARHPAA